MRIKIRDITSEGLDIVDQAMPEELDLAVEFLNLEKPIVVRGHVELVDNFVLAKVKVSYTVDTVCGRCLDPVEGEVTLDLEIDMEFRQGDKYVDLGERVREEILVVYAPHVLCREDCKGICPGCRVYLNTEECECNKRNKE